MGKEIWVVEDDYSRMIGHNECSPLNLGRASHCRPVALNTVQHWILLQRLYHRYIALTWMKQERKRSHPKQYKIRCSAAATPLYYSQGYLEIKWINVSSGHYSATRSQWLDLGHFDNICVNAVCSRIKSTT